MLLILTGLVEILLFGTGLNRPKFLEQLCPSIDSMISLVFICFCTLRHYVIVNLNVNENHVQYVHSKTDEPPRVTQYTVRELSYRKHTNKKKLFKKSVSNVIPRRPGMMFEQRGKAIGMLTACMPARYVARHFQRHESPRLKTCSPYVGIPPT